MVTLSALKIYVFCNGELIAKVANVLDVKLFIQNYGQGVTWNMDGSACKTPRYCYDEGEKWQWKMIVSP